MNSNEIIKRLALSGGVVAVLFLSIFLVFMWAMDTVTEICDKRGKFKHHETFYECKRLD